MMSASPTELRRGLIAVLVLFVSLLPAVPLQAATSAQEMYSAALQREEAVRSGLTDPDAVTAVVADVRALVEEYQNIVRRFPASGYSDNALWQAGVLSLDAFKVFGQERDRATGVRLLRLLASEYPSSSLARNVAAQLSRAAEPSLNASARKPASTLPTPATPATLPAPTKPAAAAASAIRPIVATVRSIKRELLADTVRVTIELDREVPFHEERITGPARVFVDLPSTRASAPLQDRTLRFDGDGSIVRQIRIGRHPDNRTRVVLDATDVVDYSVYPLYQPYRIVIDCVRVMSPAVVLADLTSENPALARTTKPAVSTLPLRDTGPVASRRLVRRPARLPALVVPTIAPLAAVTIPAAPPPLKPPAASTPEPPPLTASTTPPASNPGGGYSMARQLGLTVSRIVIDPGHGGHDPGAKGNSVDEAELVLDVALRVEKLLEKVPGVEVILTRRTDEYVSLPERTALANREGADLFLSIHANASINAAARGIETYYLNFARTMNAASVAARENAASGQAMNALPDLLKAIALSNKIDESRDFATAVQGAMVNQLRKSNKSVRDLGVKQAPFMVLIGAAMPSVLAEISFLSNEQESKLLRGNSYRQKIAEALVVAIQAYQSSLHNLAKVAQERP
jgi:N-acetylmuramoyl-L-alanine amidase